MELPLDLAARGEALYRAAESLMAELRTHLGHLAWLADQEPLPSSDWVRDADGEIARTTRAREKPLADKEHRARMIELCREGYFDRRLDVTKVLEFYFEQRANGIASLHQAGLLADLAARAVKCPGDIPKVIRWVFGREDPELADEIKGNIARATSDLIRVQRVYERFAEGTASTATIVLDSHEPPRPDTAYRELLERALQRYQ